MFMSTRQGSARARQGSDLPLEIYSSLVASLYSDPRTLVIGGLGSVGAAFITAWKTGDRSLFLCTAAMAVVICARAADVHAFRRQYQGATTIQAVRYWELRYVAGASVYVALMGVWCLLIFAKISDPFVQLISFSMVLVNMIGVTGRNFGSELLVSTQLTCAGIPMTVALFIMGNTYYAVFACVLFPFFLSIKSIADRLRRTLLDAVISARDVTLLADRFDTALNNMPHGLCMFDATGRLVVTNKRLAEHLNISSDDACPGTLARHLFMRFTAGTFSDSGAERQAAEFESRLSSRLTDDFVVSMRDGRTLSFTFQPMENGGSVVLVEDITERKNAEAKIKHLARYDSLTGLPNRCFFRDQMDEALASLKPDELCAVLFVDLDQFKQVNDTLGHPSGDELLCTVASRMRRIVRETDTVARFGGDEFVVLQKPLVRIEDAASMARRIVGVVQDTYEISGHQVVVGATIGIAVAPRDGLDADVLLKNADMALYRAKFEDRGSARFFMPEMDVQTQARRNLELDLRNAVAQEALEVFFQPLVNLRTRRISACEALLRWNHPQRGPVSPAEFIPIAEELGLIIEIGDWVLRQACIECAKWPGNVRVAVNFSPIQFRRGDLLRSVEEALAVSGLSPNRLEVEITESVLLQDTKSTILLLQKLRDTGIRISLDDFGTGYSSLSYLHKFPLHKVKIDRSFLSGISAKSRSLTLLRGIARLSAGLGMSVAMEGIETKEQLALIAREGSIEEAQGFLFSPAIAATQIRALLASTKPHDLVPVARSRSVA